MSATDTFVLYKGDDVVGVGSQRELAQKLGVTERSIYFLSTPSAWKRADNSRGDASQTMIAVRVRAEELA